MAVPKRRTSRSRKGKRRSHHGITPRGYTYCDQCGEPNLNHVMCPQCGWSNTQGRELISMEKAKKE